MKAWNLREGKRSKEQRKRNISCSRHVILEHSTSLIPRLACITGIAVALGIFSASGTVALGVPDSSPESDMSFTASALGFSISPASFLTESKRSISILPALATQSFVGASGGQRIPFSFSAGTRTRPTDSWLIKLLSERGNMRWRD